ncbi:MAG: alkaline phosphatase [Phycisphaerae bacterium]|nr:alkaline phosphatase [Phycisphaerae bacterium]
MRWIIIRTAQRMRSIGSFSPAVRHFSIVVLLMSVGLLAAAQPSPPKVDVNDLSFYQPSAETTARLQTTGKGVDNVIFCIGDGMGLTQVAMARVKSTGLDGKLCLEKLPVTGLVRTHSANSSVTDSAAAGTALACGVKTKNAMIGMTPDEQGYRTILEAAKDKGMATGLVVTSTISHATPATFASHVKSRKMEDKIAEQLLANRVNVLFGGGKKFFLPKSAPKSGRKDDLDLLAAARTAGYDYIETTEAMQSLCGSYVLGLFQLEGLKTVAPEPSLAQLTGKAIELLSRIRPDSPDGRAGFFLMVEGSQIDWGCHSNKANVAVRQTLLFDQAVEAAVGFALKDGHTLVIVTADHETGGLTLIGGGSEDKADAQLTPRWSTKGHSGTPVAVYAMGPGAGQFAGVQDNTEIPKKIARLLYIRPFPRPTQ